MKKIFFVMLTAFVLVGCAANQDVHNQSDEHSEEKLDIVASFYPLAFFAQEIVGERGHVVNLAGARDVHEYMPTPQDVQKIGTADVFIYHGAGLEPWAEDLAMQIPENVSVVMTIHEAELHFSDDHEHDEGGEHEHHEYDHEMEEDHHGHDHGAFDPHTWLDPVQAQEIVQDILAVLIARDPEGKDVYETNAQTLIGRLDELDQKYANTLNSCSVNEAITSHDAFEYIACRYGFTLHPIAGLSTQDEPSAAKLAELREEAEEGVTHILVEENSSQRFADVLARETGLVTRVLNPLGKGTGDANKDYFVIMEENLYTFKEALGCK